MVSLHIMASPENLKLIISKQMISRYSMGKKRKNVCQLLVKKKIWMVVFSFYQKL